MFRRPYGEGSCLRDAGRPGEGRGYEPIQREDVEAIEVGGTPVKQFAEQKGLSTNNAGVRVFRAREALKKRVMESCGICAEHGCENCTCQRVV